MQKLNPLKRTSRLKLGFTLVELLVVISCILLLGAILFSASKKVIGHAQSATCMGNLRNIGAAMFSYASDNNGMFPSMFRAGKTAATASTYDYWDCVLGEYLGMSDKQIIGVDMLRCPSKRREEVRSYGANYPQIIGTFPGQSGSGWIDPMGTRRISSVVDRRAFLVADATSAPIYSPINWPLQQDLDKDGVPDSNSSSLKFNRISFRHGWEKGKEGKANFFLLNGAVVQLSPKEFANNRDNIWGKADYVPK